MSDQPLDFVAKLRALEEERAAEYGESSLPPPVPQPEFSSDVLLPDLGGYEKSEDEVKLDGIIEGIDLATAYNKWIGKSHAVQSKPDGNMISCPNPDHPDKNPSAWFDTEGKWYCGRCDDGGDKYDLAAIRFGYPRPGYKEGQTFHKLREDMAQSFGWVIKKVPGGEVIYKDDYTPPAPPSSAPPPPPPTQPAAVPPPVVGLSLVPNPETPADPDDVSHMWADDEEPELVIYPTLNWRQLVPEDTFLYEYMKACSQDDSPEEYHFWHGLIALGHMGARKVTLDDNRPVYGNFLLCLLGATGTGKSRSRGWLDKVLREAAPYHEDGAQTTGVKLVPVPGSGEYLVKAFSYEGKDLANGKTSLGFQSVNGIVDFDEMAALLARANRQGSSLKPTIMGLADARDHVSIGSLTSGDYYAQEPFCSITASTQPKAIRALLSRTDTGSGFLNRWIFAGGKEKESEALGGSHSATVIDLTQSIELLKNIRGWAALERHITLEPDAYELYVDYFHKTLAPRKIKDETDLLKRIDLISKKLMLLLTINQRRVTVPKQVVEAVIVMMEYVVECFGILNSNIGITLMQDVMNEIQRHIIRHQQKTGRGASPRDIAKYTARKNYSLDQIKKALDVMSSLDIIELEPRQNMGRPTVRYRVVGE